MASQTRKALSKDEIISAQRLIIEQLQAKLQRISGGAQAAGSGPDFASTSAEGTADQGLPGIEMPTISLEELSAYSDIQPIEFVSGQVTLLHAPVVATRGNRAANKRGKTTPAKRRRRTSASESMERAQLALSDGDGLILVNVDGGQDQIEGSVTPSTSAASDQISHILVLGTPHTRKIPLKCPVENCVHGDYKAWDRDLLLKHFKRYHDDTHPNPAFNYLCPAEECKFISYNEPSYALYTHIKNVHQEYLKKLEQNLADGVPVVERDLAEAHIDKLPSQIQRTPVPVLGVLNMEKTGMRCPLPVCAGGTQVYKSSSMKRLNDHFAKVHNFTHPNPIFVFCCPVPDCDYTSDVGNFRVYYHLKATHPEYCAQLTGVKYASPSPTLAATSAGPPVESGETGEAPTTDVNIVSGDAGPVEGAELVHEDETESLPGEQGMMVLDPLTCPIEDCPKEGFFATSTATLRRHFRRMHRQTHPNPDFSFLCPVEGCAFISCNKITMNIWRHTMKAHPEIWLPTTHPSEDSSAATEIGEVDGAPAANGPSEAQTVERPLEEMLIVEAVQDVLNPHMLVKPTQMRCLHPGCVKPPFAGSDKVQLMRHYAHFHPEVDRLQPIRVVCPFKDCDYQCGWPAKPLFYHVEAVHGKSAEEALLPSKTVKGRSKVTNLVDGRSPIRIVGRPTAAGEFWCPVPGCTYHNGVLLNLRLHIVEKHSATYPNPAFIFVCPLQGCSFAKQNNYQALCTHMQREHGMKREKKPSKSDTTGQDVSSRSSPSKRKREEEEAVETLEEHTVAIRDLQEAMDEEHVEEATVPVKKPAIIAPSPKKQKVTHVARTKTDTVPAQKSEPEKRVVAPTSAPAVESLRRGGSRKAKAPKKLRGHLG